jgi:hypothetical protein
VKRLVKAVGVLICVVGWGGGLLVFGWALAFWGMSDIETLPWCDTGFLSSAGSWLVTMVILTVAIRSINRAVETPRTDANPAGPMSSTGNVTAQ